MGEISKFDTMFIFIWIYDFWVYKEIENITQRRLLVISLDTYVDKNTVAICKYTTYIRTAAKPAWFDDSAHKALKIEK